MQEWLTAVVHKIPPQVYYYYMPPYIWKKLENSRKKLTEYLHQPDVKSPRCCYYLPKTFSWCIITMRFFLPISHPLKLRLAQFLFLLIKMSCFISMKKKIVDYFRVYYPWFTTLRMCELLSGHLAVSVRLLAKQQSMNSTSILMTLAWTESQEEGGRGWRSSLSCSYERGIKLGYSKAGNRVRCTYLDPSFVGDSKTSANYGTLLDEFHRGL